MGSTDQHRRHRAVVGIALLPALLLATTAATASAAAPSEVAVGLDRRPAALADRAVGVRGTNAASSLQRRVVTIATRTAERRDDAVSFTTDRSAGFRLSLGRRQVRITDLQADGAGATPTRITARIDGSLRRHAFRVADVRVTTSATGVTVRGQLDATASTAQLLGRKLGARDASAGRIGRFTLRQWQDAQSTPAPAPIPTPLPAPAPTPTPTPVEPTPTPVDPEPNPEPPAVRKIAGGQLDWAFHRMIVSVFSCSYPNMVCPWATDGATVTGDTPLTKDFHFPVVEGGSYDTRTGAARVQLRGLIRLGYVAPGHSIASWIKDPLIELDPEQGVGLLSAESASATSVPADTWVRDDSGTVVDGSAANAWVPELTFRSLADLDLSTEGTEEAPAAAVTESEDGRTITWSNVGAAATAEGALIGHGQLPEGTPFEPLTLRLELSDEAADPVPAS